jgi:hypothetical protein
MAGLSSRFLEAGYILPKYMLYIIDKSVFNIVLSSFKSYFDACDFLFIARDMFDTKTFISNECKLLGIKNFAIVILQAPTRGQAETVVKGLEQAKLSPDESILVFNIDSFRPNYTIPSEIDLWDGYLEVFKGSGVNWSYAKTETPESTRVIETAEKREISNNCSTGLYYFKRAELFVNAYNSEIWDMDKNLKELYVAPLYNQLIKRGLNIHIHVVDRNEITICGTPQEYVDYLTLRTAKKVNETSKMFR